MVRLEIYFENMGTDLLNEVGVVTHNNEAFQGREDVKKGAGEIKILNYAALDTQARHS